MEFSRQTTHARAINRGKSDAERLLAHPVQGHSISLTFHRAFEFPPAPIGVCPRERGDGTEWDLVVGNFTRGLIGDQLKVVGGVEEVLLRGGTKIRDN